MSPIAKSALTFLVLVLVGVVISAVQGLGLGQGFRIDLAMTFGIAAGGAVMMFVHECTRDDK